VASQFICARRHAGNASVQDATGIRTSGTLLSQTWKLPAKSSSLFLSRRTDLHYRLLREAQRRWSKPGNGLHL